MIHNRNRLFFLLRRASSVRTGLPVRSRKCFSSTRTTAVANVATTDASSSSKIQMRSSDGVVATPIDFDVSSRVSGSESQVLTVLLKKGQVLRAESGAMMYMTEV